MCLVNAENWDRATHADLFVLAFVFDLHREPVVALFPDPWQLRGQGSFRLHTSHEFKGQFRGGAPYVCGGADGAPDPAEYEAYQYRNLQHDEIRILHLLPGAVGDPVRGTIRHVRLGGTRAHGSAGEYLAVSYVWGDKRLVSHLDVEGQGKIAITRNLDSVLRVLREKYPLTPLWIDAICQPERRDGKGASGAADG